MAVARELGVAGVQAKSPVAPTGQSGGDRALAADTENVYVPAALGVPERRPVGLIVLPGGGEPTTSLYVGAGAR